MEKIALKLTASNFWTAPSLLSKLLNSTAAVQWRFFLSDATMFQHEITKTHDGDSEIT